VATLNAKYAMSTLSQHKHHLSALQDIREIMAALKNISLTESMRLRRFLESQQRVITGIEQAMADFLGHFPQTLPGSEGEFELVLLIGSERGFCGDFNEGVLTQFTAAAHQTLLAVGEKLGAKLEEARLSATILTGPTTVEDVPEILVTVIDKLRELNAGQGASELTIVYQHYDGHTIEARHYRPFRDFSSTPSLSGYPPLLNIPPSHLFPALIDHYLFAVLHGIFYSSLTAEHQLRLQHLQGAIDHIDRESAELTRHYNSLRQELITEEIEMILLSAGPHMQEQ